MIENTSKRDPLDHVLGVMGAGPDGYIEGQEAAGGAQLVASSELMPKEGPWVELQALGFGAPEETDDVLFVRTTLPPGWSKQAGSGDPRGSRVVDERGVDRVDVFYKAAFYDRRADCHLINVGRNIAIEVIYSDPAETAKLLIDGLPAKWDVLTEDERASYVAGLDGYLDDARRHPDIYGDRAPRVKALRKAVVTP